MICPLLIVKEIGNIIRLSGRGINQFGKYHLCNERSNMNYNFIMLTTEDGVSLYDGLCLPKQCTKNIIQTSINTLIQSGHIPLQLTTLETQNDIQSYTYETTFSFWLAIIIAMSIAALLFIANCCSGAKHSKLVSSFNFKTNMQTFNYNIKSNLNVFNGIKTFCMLWVILGHSQAFSIGVVSNAARLPQQFQKPETLIIEAGLFAVDTFFFIGGMLVAYSFLKAKGSSIAKYFLAILHRILRFWPAYIFVILIYHGIFMHLGKGPVWYQQQLFVSYCDQMWKPILFVNNLVGNGMQQCLEWGWYIQNDMQLYAYSIFLLFILNKSRIGFHIVLWGSILASCIYTFVICYINEYKTLTHIEDFPAFFDTYFTKIYVKPWARCPPYLIGLFLGVCYTDFVNYHKNQNQNSGILVKIGNLFRSRILRLLCQFLGIGLLIFIVFIPRTKQKTGQQWPQIIQSLYLSLGKVTFIIGLALTILPSILGVNSFVRFGLDTKAYSFIGKISFSTYLVHLMIIFYFLGNINQDFYFSVLRMIPKYLGYALLSMFFGFVLYMCIETPFAKIQKHLLGKFVYYLMESKQKTKHHQNQKQQKNQILNDNIQSTGQLQSKNLLNQHEEKIQLNQKNEEEERQDENRRFSIN